MTILELVKSSTEISTDPQIFETGCKDLGLSLPEFCDAFAIEVARQYHNGFLSWDDCDGAINSLFYAYVHNFDQATFPELAYSVFSAFDDGEYLHPGDPESFDPQTHTKTQIKTIISRLGA